MPPGEFNVSPQGYILGDEMQPAGYTRGRRSKTLRIGSARRDQLARCDQRRIAVTEGGHEGSASRVPDADQLLEAEDALTGGRPSKHR